MLVSKGQKVAQSYFLTYRENIPTLRLVQELATVMQEFTQRGYVHVRGCEDRCTLSMLYVYLMGFRVVFEVQLTKS